jgi:predicted transcriptional regulator
MAKVNSEIETVVFQALSHPMRRTIITILGGNIKGLLYTELITELGLTTGKMNYHIEQLEGLIEKNQDRRYVLTPLGKKALDQLKQLKVDITNEDMKYLKIAEKSQKASLEPTIKSFIVIGIVTSLFVTTGLLTIAYFAITTGGFPTIMLLVLPVGLAIEIAVLATLIHALRKTPDWLRRLERKYLAS